MLAYVLGAILMFGGIFGFNDPSTTEKFNAQLVECYDKYDSGGELVYMCDYRDLATSKIVEKQYQRQAWREMQTGVGTVYTLERSTWVGIASMFAFVIGIAVLFINWATRD